MAGPYPTLLSPVRIGRHELRNRTVMLPMGTRLPVRGIVDERDTAWHRVRAAGGVGAVITGATIVHPSTRARSPDSGLIEAYRPEGQDGQKRRVEAIHEGGAIAIGQILHLGRELAGAQVDGPLVGPSPLRSPRDWDPPHELDHDEIAILVEAFAHTARMQEEAGYDGVEIHGAHGYLVAQFLSADSNRRDDEYGAHSLENRTRFLVELLTAIRAVTAPGLALGVRLTVDEETADGLTPPVVAEIAGALDATGLLDYFSLTIGMRGAYVKDTSYPPGFSAARVAQVKAATTLPVIAASRITTPAVAEAILAAGQADAVGLGRALIADPEWPLKAAAGQAERIRPCVGFVQDCRVAHGGALCGVHSDAGRETDWPRWERDAPPAGRVTVVGGGPGGLEAARVAAEAGHAVTLFEADRELGGQWRLAAAGPERGELLSFVRYLSNEVVRLGVDVRTGTPATVEAVRSTAPDLVVAATGSRPVAPSFAGAGVPVLTAHALLRDGAEEWAGRPVLVADDGAGFWPSCSAAELLAHAGAHVWFATPAPAIGLNIPHESVGPLHRRLRSRGAEYLPLRRLAAVGDGVATLADTAGGAPRELEVAMVVVAAGSVPERALADALRAAGLRVRAIGDCVAPRRVGAAVHEANVAVRTGWKELLTFAQVS